MLVHLGRNSQTEHEQNNAAEEAAVVSSFGVQYAIPVGSAVNLGGSLLHTKGGSQI